MDPKYGLTGEDFPKRTVHFGSNYRPPLIAKSWLKLFWAALDDFMLKVLIFASIFSIVFDMVLASPSHRKHGKSPTIRIFSLVAVLRLPPLRVRARSFIL